MKYRRGFVSNSSSDSFIIATGKTAEQFKDWLQGICNAVNETPEGNLDDNLTIYEVGSKGADVFLEEVSEYYDRDKFISNRINYIKETAKEKKLKILRIDSTGDNSIPWSIQQTIEDLTAVRVHWG